MLVGATIVINVPTRQNTHYTYRAISGIRVGVSKGPVGHRDMGQPSNVSSLRA